MELSGGTIWGHVAIVVGYIVLLVLLYFYFFYWWGPARKDYSNVEEPAGETVEPESEQARP